MIVRRTIRFFDQRLGVAPQTKKLLRYVFPDHWSFMLGEIALYAFVLLIATGVYLTFFYIPSDAPTVYRGDYAPLRGVSMSEAYWSVLTISIDVPAGLVMRQAHHWAADIFVGAIGLHMVRILFTGAFRRPREINYWIGLTMLMIAVFEGFLGYSLIDDLYSGMGLVIAYGVGLSLPFIGADAMFLAFDGAYPGAADIFPRMFITHVLILPMAIAALIGVHLAIIMRQHHTQFPGPKRTERNVVGTPMYPGYALRSIGLFFAVTAMVFLLAGLVQINPIWLWGPYETYLSTNAAQPDYYIGWLIGGLRLMPPLELQIGDYTIVPNAFWGGAFFPLFCFAVLYLWPFIDRRFFGDGRHHELLDRPRDNPRRSAALVAFLGWVAIVFIAGSSDRTMFRIDISYEAQIWFWRVMAVLWPPIAYYVAKRFFMNLQHREAHPLRGWSGTVVRRREDGGFETLDGTDGATPESAEEQRPPVSGPR